MGLFSDVNKAKKKGDEDGADAPIPEFKSSMSDSEIQKLTRLWRERHYSYIKDIETQQKDNYNYWIGKHYNDLQTAGAKKPLVDNLLFEAVETFLPIATRGNPEAIVEIVGSSEDDAQTEEQKQKLVGAVQCALKDKADTLHLRMKLKAITRHWILNLLGSAKVVWNTKKNDVDLIVVNPTNLIVDPHAEITVAGQYKGDYIGEKKKLSARKLTQLFPEKKAIIAEKASGAMGTKLQIIEWWTPDDVFFTLEEEVLGSFKHPHWNYDGDGVEGKNHFEEREIPYVCLSVFNLGKRPHDETSLMTQNVSLQDLINRRYQQIDKNVDSQNQGIVLSGKYFTKEQAAEAATQLSRGNPLWVPEGDISQAYVRDTAPALPGTVFEHLNDARNELRNIFGTSGSTPEALEGQKTVRGKIMINQLDASRIGGGVTEYIELLAETINNWWLQMMYVYYTETHRFPSDMGDEITTLINTDLIHKLKVTIKEGSLIPKDPLTKRNEAMDLWSAQAIDPISLYEALDFPNPKEAAKKLLIWQMVQQGKLSPTALWPDFQMPPTQLPQGTGMVSEAEANHEVNPPSPASPEAQSQEIISSVPIQ